MDTINQYFDKIKEKHNLSSDYALAKMLGQTRSSVSIVRHGGSVKNKTAIKMAGLLDIDAAPILLAATVERTTNPIEKTTWERISKLIGEARTETAAMLLISLVIFSTFENATSAFSLLCKKLQYFKHRKKQELSRLFASTENDNLAVLNIQ